VSFDIPNAKLKMAELYGEQKTSWRPGAGTRMWRRTSKASGARGATPLDSLPPRPSVPLVDRWGARNSGLLCAIRMRKEQDIRRTAAVLVNDFRSVKMAA